MLLLGVLTLLHLFWLARKLLVQVACERDFWVIQFGSFGLAGLLLVLFGAVLLPWASPVVSFGLMAVPSVCCYWLTSKGGATLAVEAGQPKLQLLLSLPGVVLVAIFSLFIMSVSQVVDDGFFLHTSNMGMFTAGHYPPYNFLGEPLQGHFGKDLLTALLAMASSTDFLTSEWVSTVLIQVLHFAFLFSWFRSERSRISDALLGTYFAFFASHSGSHLGLADTVTNNNAVAFFSLSLCGYLLRRWLVIGTWQMALLAGVCLGADALIYELHFGLLGLTLFVFTLTKKQRYKQFLLVVLAAFIVAAVEGGAISHLFQRLVSGPAPYQANAKKSYQSQTVELRFPKQNVFWLRLDNLRPSRPFETKLRPFEGDFRPSRGSAPIWSASILQCFWYPVWLSPLVLAWILRTRNGLAGWFFCLGMFSVLTPCIVSFGYFENETGRWFFGAAVGFSVAYALALSDLIAVTGRLRYLSYLVLGWSLWFNFATLPTELNEIKAAVDQPGQPLRDGSPGVVPGGGLLPQPRLSLAHHYKFFEDDWRVNQKLRELVGGQPDYRSQRVLTNFRDDAPPTNGRGVELATGGLLNIIGLQTGLSGVLPAGIGGAPQNEWSPPMFSQSLQARAFWSDPRPWRVRDLKANWLLIHEDLLEPVARRQLFQELALTEVDRQGQICLQRVVLSPGPDSYLPVTKLSVESAQTQARQAFTLDAQFDSHTTGSARLDFRYVASDGDQDANSDDRLHEELELANSAGRAQLHLVGPYYPGSYRLEWKNSSETQWQSLCLVEVH